MTGIIAPCMTGIQLHQFESTPYDRNQFFTGAGFCSIGMSTSLMNNSVVMLWRMEHEDDILNISESASINDQAFLLDCDWLFQKKDTCLANDNVGKTPHC